MKANIHLNMKFFAILSIIFATLAIARKEGGNQVGNTSEYHNPLAAIIEFAAGGDADLDANV